MRRSRFRYECLLLVLLFTDSAAADLFTGDFTASLDGQVYQLSISGFAGGQYDGEYRVRGENLPLSARRFGDSIAGQIGIADFRFGFLAQEQNGGLLLKYEDGTVILFRRVNTATGIIEEVSAD